MEAYDQMNLEVGVLIHINLLKLLLFDLYVCHIYHVSYYFYNHHIIFVYEVF